MWVSGKINERENHSFVVRKNCRGGVAGFMFTALVACLGCPGASEQDTTFPGCGHRVAMRQGALGYRKRLEFESWLCHLLDGCPWVGLTSLGLTCLTFKMG